MMLQLSESTNIIGTTIKCSQLFSPYFKSIVETVRKELTQLPTQDFSWVPRSCSYHWDNIHSIAAEWFRPNPLCCKHHDRKLNETMLTKAIDSFNQNAELIAHQLLWKSKHEAAFFHVGNPRTNMPSILSTAGKPTLMQQHDLELESRAGVISEFLKLWVERIFSAVDWIQALLGGAGDSQKLWMTGGKSFRLLKMGEIVSSAIVHETVNKIISGMIDKYEQKTSVEEQLERLEMAQIKLELALETSNKWQITSDPLLCWQKKLKRASEDKELVQLPTQDFSWVSHYRSYHWDNIHGIATEWFRPNPLCCKHHSQRICASSTMDKAELPDVALQPIIEVYLERQIIRSRCNRQRAVIQIKDNKQGAAVRGKRCTPRRPSHLKLGVLLLPHSTSNDLLPAAESSAVEVINGEEQPCYHTNITLEQLDKVMLPKAIDSFNQNAEATAHQLLWKSKHGAAFFHLGKTRMNMPSAFCTARKATWLERQELDLESRASLGEK
uniref:Uncharacterized protein n=1 Tax=Leersia perrieri TaxID=77586 RepID=A0A0D9WV27_9ORYZ